jgi:hypothetical protein
MRTRERSESGRQLERLNELRAHGQALKEHLLEFLEAPRAFTLLLVEEEARLVCEAWALLVDDIDDIGQEG